MLPSEPWAVPLPFTHVTMETAGWLADSHDTTRKGKGEMHTAPNEQGNVIQCTQEPMFSPSHDSPLFVQHSFSEDSALCAEHS